MKTPASCWIHQQRFTAAGHEYSSIVWIWIIWVLRGRLECSSSSQSLPFRGTLSKLIAVLSCLRPWMELNSQPLAHCVYSCLMVQCPDAVDLDNARKKRQTDDCVTHNHWNRVLRDMCCTRQMSWPRRPSVLLRIATTRSHWIASNYNKHGVLGMASVLFRNPHWVRTILLV